MLAKFIRQFWRGGDKTASPEDVDALLSRSAALLEEANSRVEQQAEIITQYHDLVRRMNADFAEITGVWETEIRRLQEQDAKTIWELAAYQRWCWANGVPPAQSDLERMMGGPC